MKSIFFRRTKEIPSDLKPILWSHDLAKIDLEKDRKTIIINVINYGNLRQWRWLAENYNRESVREILMEIPATEIRPGARRLASIIFNVKQFNYAPRGTH